MGLSCLQILCRSRRARVRAGWFGKGWSGNSRCDVSFRVPSVRNDPLAWDRMILKLPSWRRTLPTEGGSPEWVPFDQGIADGP
jgi:hypothetical protein